ncbi:succinylglutamate desuccinylase/aspartoacylase family protein [Desulfosediminicola flagellatus]|uniref:succinylglutamate desuccinylase/aspartoacylase family protein n=1 Tax=Desulfosediminicola flagellatus TaxID=2569541 RepID=UPI001C3E5613|nr:succinylglutamate desuccinylase/aspartoacylase family protein [Desulfosediminicola flagellatus]
MKQESFRIGNAVIVPGSQQLVELPVAHLYTHTQMSLTAHVVHGRRPGPRLFVSAALHGDEINGVEIIRRLLKRKTLASLKGTLIAIPVVNSFGFINHSRYLPDRRDLNRVFPGSVSGSLASRIADLFMTEIASKCTHGIDLHTGSNHRFNLPQVRASLKDKETKRLAQAFGAPVMLHSKLRDGSLREAVAELGIPMLLYEAGEALRFDELSIRTGLRGIVSVMRSIGMLPAKASRRSHAVFPSSLSKWVRSPISGILSRRAAIGAQVVKGDVIAIVHDPYGETEEKITAPVSGVIIGRLQLPLVYQGDALFHIAVLEGDPDAGQIVEELTSDFEQSDFIPPKVGL